MDNLRKEALEYHHLDNKPGKISILPTKPLDTQRDLGLAYTPGVAEPVLEIARDPDAAYQYTSKGNLVAVVSNGTAILGLGNKGPLASKPVMEGKGVLFKKFADIDVFDIEINAKTVEEIIQVVSAIAPTFGGINLEDIKSPECFEVERRLEEALDIPVFHDDQHGTAIISGAGLLNALELVGKDIAKTRIVVSGAGASAISCARMAVLLGAKRENILLVDSRGVVHSGRDDINQYKREFMAKTDARSLADAVKDADVFYGLSVADVLKPEMVKTMAKQPLIFAMANPDPEIRYEVAKAARPDAIVATGRSDYPNQINNVLGFPFIFRGALDVRATHINEDMKVAAAKSLAALAKEDVPDSVLRAYGVGSLKFGPDYIIPTPFDPRVLLWEAPAVAEAAMRSGVARIQVDIEKYRDDLAARQGRGQQVRQYFMNRAKQLPKLMRVVFPEGEDSKVLRAAAQLEQEGIAHPILIARPEVLAEELQQLGLRYEPEVVDIRNFERMPEYTEDLYQLRQRRGGTLANAEKQMRDRNVFGAMMVKLGDADAMVSGRTFEYPEVIRPALQVHHTAPDVNLVCGVYIMIVEQRVYLFTDATVNIDPDKHALADIAILAADFAQKIGLEPRVAMLSFSNFGSTPHPSSSKVRDAVELVRQRRPDLLVDGEMQADTAVVAEIVDQRYPFSRVQNANVLVFPSLEAANISYKLLNRLGKAQTIGPILLGLGAPIQVLQTGDEVRDIVNMAAVAALDAAAYQEADAPKKAAAKPKASKR
ncbi:MAG: NADP-dependent malic enzyme [Anaerolineales bacterium]|nr:NADP-dependent malic enzyme [Anaerolineales bacterium]MCW5856397.1 NADP-dependent malic enzyme [Anaerolineales bacterium]